MIRIAVSEGAIPASSMFGLRDMGQSVWMLPDAEARGIRRMIEEFPPDVVILSVTPDAPQVAAEARIARPSLRILAATEDPRVEAPLHWADLSVPRQADPSLWFLAAQSVRPGVEPFSDEGGVRAALLSAVEAAHRAFRSVGLSRGDGAVAGQLERSFETLLRLGLEQLERETHGDAGHSARVAALCRHLALAVGLSAEAAEEVALAGLLHDLGMHLTASPTALSRQGPLSEEEWQVIKSHPAASAAVVSPLPGNQATTNAILAHHERLDGTGYPSGTQGKEIPLGGRIVAVADTYEAMTHARPHRPAMSADEALETLYREGKDGRFDPDICGALASVLTTQHIGGADGATSTEQGYEAPGGAASVI